MLSFRSLINLLSALQWGVEVELKKKMFCGLYFLPQHHFSYNNSSMHIFSSSIFKYILVSLVIFSAGQQNK